MIKYIVYIFIGLISFGTNEQIEVIYQKRKRYTVDEYIEKYVKTDNPAILDQIRNTYDKVRTDYALIQRGKTSSYYSPEFIDSESGHSKTIRTKTGKKNRYSNLEAKNLYVKNFLDGSFQAMLHSRSSEHYISDIIPTLDWSLQPEKKTILGYVCHKATIEPYKGFDVEAWYSPEITISNGPMEYGGLPGLILELNFASMTYIAKEINFNSTSFTSIDTKDYFNSDVEAIKWHEYLDIYYK